MLNDQHFPRAMPFFALEFHLAIRLRTPSPIGDDRHAATDDVCQTAARLGAREWGRSADGCAVWWTSDRSERG